MAEGTRLASRRMRPGRTIRVVISNRRRGGLFRPGGDLREIRRKRSSLAFPGGIARVFKTTLAIVDIEKPVIAAVNGPAVGVAFNMALACDIIVWLPKRLSFSEIFVHVGLIPDGGGAFPSCRESSAWPKPKELIYTGKINPAQRSGGLWVW